MRRRSERYLDDRVDAEKRNLSLVGRTPDLVIGDDPFRRQDHPVRGHRHSVHDQFDGRPDRVIAGELRIEVADHLIGPVEELLALILGNAHQTGDRLQR